MWCLAPVVSGGFLDTPSFDGRFAGDERTAGPAFENAAGRAVIPILAWVTRRDGGQSAPSAAGRRTAMMS